MCWNEGLALTLRVSSGGGLMSIVAWGICAACEWGGVRSPEGASVDAVACRGAVVERGFLGDRDMERIVLLWPSEAESMASAR